MNIFWILTGLISLYVFPVSASEYSLNITSDSPIAIGTSVTFNVTLLVDGKIAPNNKYQFRYNFLRKEELKETHSPSETFVVNAEDLEHGHYEITFFVDEFYIFTFFEKVHQRTIFNITNRFNGVMQLVQNPNNTVRDNGYVSSQSDTFHNIIISDKDRKLFDKAEYIRVFWFIDCQYLGVTDTLNLTHWYNIENGIYNVEALLELSYEPLPSPTSSTTTTTTTTSTTTTSTTTTSTTTTTTSTTPSTTTSSSTTTTTPPTTTSTTTTTTKKPNTRRRRDAETPPFEWNIKHLIETGSIKPETIANQDMLNYLTTTALPMSERIKKLNDENVPYFGMCTSNSSRVISDQKKIYGYYHRLIKVENPLTNVTVENNVWLKHGEFCNLKIKYVGTAPFKYCINITSSNGGNVSAISSSNEDEDDDNDDCNDWKTTNDKEMNIHKFLSKSSNSYTVTLYLHNEVSSIKTPIGVKFIEEQPHSQLSVIIVPVMFSLVAVVIIVFGIAFYVQNRNQFLIETADFDFGETSSVESMEYKSFLQRLLDSVSDLFIRQDYLEETEGPSPSGPATSQDSNVRYGAFS